MVSFFEKAQNGKQLEGGKKQEEDFAIKISGMQEDKEKQERKWLETEGQLAVDVFQTEDDLVIQSTIAGVRGDDLDIAIEGDKVTIRGKREKPTKDEKINYFYQECYWGPFSREIILPVEIDPSRATALFKEGVLIIRMPKIAREKKRKIAIRT
jgi:HSP20 family molecular chaperone IbpA